MKKTGIYGVILLIIIGAIITKSVVFHVNEANMCTQNCLTKLQNATTYELIQDPISIGKEYIIVADNEVIAKVKGKNFKSFGDAFALYSPDEKEIWLKESGRNKLPIKNGSIKFGRTSELEQSERTIGYIYERITLIGTEIDLKDTKEKPKAFLKGETFKLTSGFTITDPKEQTIYAEAKKRFAPFREDVYDVTIEDTTSISAEELLLLLVVADEENDSD